MAAIIEVIKASGISKSAKKNRIFSVAGSGRNRRQKQHTRKRAYFLIAILFLALCGLVGCREERPTHITSDQIGFLAEQSRPLLMDDVDARLGVTPFDKMRYRYITPSAAFDFYLLPYPEDKLKRFRNLQAIPMEVLMVVETQDNSKARIIWPKDLLGADFLSILKQVEPKMFSNESGIP